MTRSPQLTLKLRMFSRPVLVCLRNAFILLLMIAVVLLAAAAKRSQYSEHKNHASHLSKLVKMSESRSQPHAIEIAVIHPPATLLKIDLLFCAARALGSRTRSLITPVALLSPPLRV